MLSAGGDNAAGERMFWGGYGSNNPSSEVETEEAVNQEADYEMQTAIKTQIEETAIPQGYYTLLIDGDDYLTVTVSDGEATVTVKTLINYTIPYTAEVWLPIAQQAAEDAGATLSRFTVYFSTKTADGETYLAQWATTNGETGILVDQIGLDLKCDTEARKPGYSIDNLFDYYAEWDETVNNMIVGGGGTGYER